MEEAKQRKLSVVADPEGLRYINSSYWLKSSSLADP